MVEYLQDRMIDCMVENKQEAAEKWWSRFWTGQRGRDKLLISVDGVSSFQKLPRPGRKRWEFLTKLHPYAMMEIKRHSIFLAHGAEGSYGTFESLGLLSGAMVSVCSPTIFARMCRMDFCGQALSGSRGLIKTEK